MIRSDLVHKWCKVYSIPCIEFMYPTCTYISLYFYNSSLFFAYLWSLFCCLQLKEALINKVGMEDKTPTHFLSSTIAGGLITITTQPLDVIKTRLMNAARSDNATLSSVAIGIAKESGVSGFFKGSVPSFCRIGPQTILTFLIMEQLRKHFGYLPDN